MYLTTLAMTGKFLSKYIELNDSQSVNFLCCLLTMCFDCLTYPFLVFVVYYV